jgi:hypothetical protein
MKLQAHLLAETAQFDSEGFITVIRGGMTGATPERFPMLLRFAVLTRLWLTEQEAAGLVEMSTRVSFSGKEIAQTRQPLNINRSDPSRIFINCVNNLQLLIDRPGLIQIEASVQGMGLPLLELPVDPTVETRT